MRNAILVACLTLGLVACGGEGQQAADETDGAGTPPDVAGGMNVPDPADQAPTFADLQAAFVAEYAQDESTVISDSGLMYRVLREGDGASPDANDVVEVHYEGRLIDGSVFDSSYEREETIEFPLNRLIPGWIEGVQYMQEGAKYQLVIPPALGYGQRSDIEAIPPGSVLIFDLELFTVTPVE